jgi:metal-responsive CopG/Arc/MetJ family transcriptional regulator
MTYHSVYFPDDVHSEIETRRGSMSRSGFIAKALRTYLSMQENGGVKESVRGQIYQDPSPTTEHEKFQEEYPIE